MRRVVSAALLLADGFTGLPLEEGWFFVRQEGGKSYLKKAGGYLVFTDIEDRELRLTIGGGEFLQRQLSLDVNDLMRRNVPLLTVYLYPSERYPFPPGVIFQEQSGYLPDHLAKVMWKDTARAVRLERDCGETDKEVCLRNRGGLLLADREIFLVSPQNQEGEMVVLGELLNSREGLYGLTVPPKGRYDCQTTEICLTYEGKADCGGRVLIPHIQ